MLRDVRTPVQAQRRLPQMRIQIGALVVTVDPKVYALAESFIDDTLQDRDKASAPWSQTYVTFRNALVQRAAEAMQQAIEDECEAIRKELQP